MNKKLAHRILSNLEALAHKNNKIERAIELSKAATKMARGN